MTDSVRAGVAATDAQLDGTLLDAALSDRWKFSKFAMAIGSTTANKGGCELFMAELDELAEDVTEAWTEISSMGERYDKCINAVISSAYVSTPEGEMTDDFYIQDW